MTPGTSRTAWTPLAAVAALIFTGCFGGGADGPFVDISDEAGLTYILGTRTALLTPHPMATLTGGVAVGDYDNDGWDDLYVVDSARNALYRNLGGGRFADVTEAVGAADPQDGRAALFFDYDNDGWKDLFIVNFLAPTKLLRNVEGRFEDVTEGAGLGRISTAHGAAAADIDGDGDLDLFLPNYGRWTRVNPEYYVRAENAYANLLYVNGGDGTFTEEAAERGLTATRWSFAGAFADADGDGDADLYVANDFGRDEFYRNDGAGRFEEVAADVGAFTDRNGMGVTWADFDNDADLDLYVSNIHIPGTTVPTLRGNNLFENEGGRFRDVAEGFGVAEGLWSWGSVAFDAENDGDLDLLVTTGFASREKEDLFYQGGVRLLSKEQFEAGEGLDIRFSEQIARYNDTHYITFMAYTRGKDIFQYSQAGYQPNRFFEQVAPKRFEERAKAWSLAWTADSRAAATLDFDRDGDTDLVVTSFLHAPKLYENRAPQGNHIDLILVGTVSNRDAIGAKVVAEWGGRTMAQERHAGMGFLSQSSGTLHFGLGDATLVDRLTVRWPTGKTTVFSGVEAGATYRLTEGTGHLERVDGGADADREPFK